jgi:hypothetical protein
VSPRLIRLRSSLKKEAAPELSGGSGTLRRALGRRLQFVVAIAMTQL